MMKLLCSMVMGAVIISSSVGAMSIIDMVKIGDIPTSDLPKREAVKVEGHKEVINEGPAYLPSRSPNPQYYYPNTNQNSNNNYNSNSNNNNTSTNINKYFYSGTSLVNQNIIANYATRNQIGRMTIYQVNNRSISVDHQINTIVFETPINRTLHQSIVEGDNTVIIFRNPNTNTYELYFYINGYSSHLSNVTQYTYFQPANYRKNMFIYKIVEGGYNNYSLFDLSNSGSLSSSYTSKLDSKFEQYLSQNMVYSNNVVTYTISNTSANSQFFPVGYYPVRDNTYLYQQNTVIINPYNNRPTTPDPVLTYRIKYTLGARDTKGNYELQNPTCTTNGSVDQFYIAKRPGDLSYGIGNEITYGTSKTYKVKQGDQLCCRVILSRNTYQKAGGCQLVQ